VTLALHEIPISTDTTPVTYASMDPYFQDSTLIATVAVPDTLVQGPVSVTLLPGALRHFVEDSLRAGIGLSIVSSDPAFVTVGADTLNEPANILRFVQLDSSTGTTRVTRSESRSLSFKTFVADTTGAPAPAGLRVGGTSGARAFVKLNIPAQLVDSMVMVRASLLLPPAAPVPGAPGDTFRLRVIPLGTDFGPKSPLADSTYGGYAPVGVGSTDTVVLDLTKALLLWKGNAVMPHTVMVGVIRSQEAGSIDGFDMPDPRSGPVRAILRLTYGMPFRPGR
jgi:hypothetical protein